MNFLNNKVIMFPVTSYKDYNTIKILKEHCTDLEVYTYNTDGIIGNEVSLLVNRKQIGIKIKNINNYKYNKNDIFYLPFSENESNLENITNIILDIIRKTSTNINLSDLELINYNTVDNKIINNYFNLLNKTQIKYFSINIPVILVSGIFDLIDSEYISLVLKKMFEEDGFKADCITRNKEMKLFGAFNYPYEFMKNKLSIEERIIYLNNFIRAIIEIRKPNILILNVPGGLLRYNNYFNNDFGSYAYMISQAVKNDYSILCSTYEFSSNENNQFIDILNNRFEFYVEAIHISNISFEFFNNYHIGIKNISFLNENIINKKIQNYNNKSIIYNCYNDNDIRRLYEDIINKLKGE